jgi:uncharacterized protein YbjT (DUF2867 family)
MKPILVAGATGGVGSHIVRKLLDRGAAVRVLVRDAAKARKMFGDGAAIVVGDTRNPETLGAALEGARAVICATGSGTPLGDNTPEKVDYEGVRNLAEAAKTAGVEQFVLVSSIAVTKPDHPLNAFGKVLSWKLKGEDALRASGLTYTVIRPGGLRDEPGGRTALRFDQGDRIMGMISREDVAEVCIQALGRPAAFNVTLEVVAMDGQPPVDWDVLFGALRPA